jgi:hypothetical protein
MEAKTVLQTSLYTQPEGWGVGTTPSDHLLVTTSSCESDVSAAAAAGTGQPVVGGSQDAQELGGE